MAKFAECNESDRIIYLKDEFVRIIEEIIIDPAEIKKLIPEDKFKVVMDYVPNLKCADCTCGACLSVDKLEARIPKELEPLIEIARKRCEERTYPQ